MKTFPINDCIIHIIITTATTTCYSIITSVTSSITERISGCLPIKYQDLQVADHGVVQYKGPI